MKDTSPIVLSLRHSPPMMSFANGLSCCKPGSRRSPLSGMKSMESGGRYAVSYLFGIELTTPAEQSTGHADKRATGGNGSIHFGPCLLSEHYPASETARTARTENRSGMVGYVP